MVSVCSAVYYYNAAHPIVRQVLKMMILGIPLAVGLLLQLATYCPSRHLQLTEKT